MARAGCAGLLARDVATLSNATLQLLVYLGFMALLVSGMIMVMGMK